MHKPDETAAGAIAHLEQAAQRHDVPVAGVGTIAWRCYGAGPPLVLLHGGHGSWLHWARNVAALSQRHALWLPDLPGYGDSRRPAAPTLAALVDALQASLDAVLGARTPILLAGFSFGGLVAAQLAVQRGAVARLALLGAAGHGTPRRPRGKLQSWREAATGGDAQALREVMRHNLLVHMLAGDEADALAVEIHTRSCLHTHFHSRSISLAGGLFDRLRRIEAPLWLVYGEHDVTATPADIVAALSLAQIEARTDIVAAAGHWVQYQAAERIDAMLLDWFSGG
jgi:pimeloyl-ACP methyl ester carboxylesterase